MAKEINFPSELLFIKEDIPQKIEPLTLLNIYSNSITSFTHGFHKYPAKFIPVIPRWAINKYSVSNNNIIIDPFCGSGTTLVEGLLKNQNVIGIDIDPLSALISKVKTTPLLIDHLLIVNNYIQTRIKDTSKGSFIPKCSNINHWFTSENIVLLSKIRTVIDEIYERFKNVPNINDIYDFLLICFSSIIRRVSYADNESQKTYVSHTKIKHPENPINLFTSQLQYFTDRIMLFSSTISRELYSKVICKNIIESALEEIENDFIDLAITSPPYIKSIDYLYNQMVELFWIGDLFNLDTQVMQNGYKRLYIGNKNIPIDIYNNFNPYSTQLDIKELDSTIISIFEADKKNGLKHSFITYKYFYDMEKHFTNLYEKLKKNSHYVIVVGNSNVSDHLIKTDKFIIEIAQRNGFKFINEWGYKIKNRYMRFDRKGRGGIILTDWVIDLQKV